MIESSQKLLIFSLISSIAMAAAIFIGELWVVCVVGLMIFGGIYDQLTAFCQRKGYMEGYTWLFVVGGTIVTLAVGGLLVGWETAFTYLGLFAASGSMMSIGDLYRYMKSREREQDGLGL